MDGLARSLFPLPRLFWRKSCLCALKSLPHQLTGPPFTKSYKYIILDEEETTAEKEIKYSLGEELAQQVLWEIGDNRGFTFQPSHKFYLLCDGLFRLAC